MGRPIIRGPGEWARPASRMGAWALGHRPEGGCLMPPGACGCPSVARTSPAAIPGTGSGEATWPAMPIGWQPIGLLAASNRPRGLFSVHVGLSPQTEDRRTSCDCWAPVPSKRHWFRASMAAWSNTRLGSASTTWTLTPCRRQRWPAWRDGAGGDAAAGRFRRGGIRGRPSSGPRRRREPARRKQRGQDKKGSAEEHGDVVVR